MMHKVFYVNLIYKTTWKAVKSKQSDNQIGDNQSSYKVPVSTLRWKEY